LDVILVANDLHGVNNVGGAAGHILGSLILFVLRGVEVDFLQDAVDCRTGKKDFLPDKVGFQGRMGTSFGTLFFFQS